MMYEYETLLVRSITFSLAKKRGDGNTRNTQIPGRKQDQSRAVKRNHEQSRVSVPRELLCVHPAHAPLHTYLVGQGRADPPDTSDTSDTSDT